MALTFCADGAPLGLTSATSTHSSYQAEPDLKLIHIWGWYARAMDLEARDAALRADIRRLGNQLGDSLVRQEGRELLDLVEDVRAITKRFRGSVDAGDAAALAALLDTLDVARLGTLARAFTTYFHLANVAEQTHRLDELAARINDSVAGWSALLTLLKRHG